MKPSDSQQEINALKQQVEQDTALAPATFETRYCQALSRLDQIACLCASTPLIMAQLAQVKRSLRDYYNPQFSHTWTQRFVLNDLATLEALCASEQKSGDPSCCAA